VPWIMLVFFGPLPKKTTGFPRRGCFWYPVVIAWVSFQRMQKLLSLQGFGTKCVLPLVLPALPTDILAADLDFVQPIDLWTRCTMDHIELFHGPCGYFTLMVGNKLEKVLVPRL
jgi:hypothetical protein